MAVVELASQRPYCGFNTIHNLLWVLLVVVALSNSCLMQLNRNCEAINNYTRVRTTYL